jgi:hypothetical protein
MNNKKFTFHVLGLPHTINNRVTNGIKWGWLKK